MSPALAPRRDHVGDDLADLRAASARPGLRWSWCRERWRYRSTRPSVRRGPHGRGTRSATRRGTASSGWPSRTVSRKPCSAGANVRMPQRVAVDHVDPDLEAEQVGGLVADRAGRELVEVALPGQAEVDEVHVAEARRGGRPRARPAVRLHAVTDRRAVVDPAAAVVGGRRGQRGAVVDRDGTHFDERIVRQPQLDQTRARRARRR